MKKQLLAISILAMLSVPAFASDEGEGKLEYQHCVHYSEMARNIVRLHNGGFKLVDLLDKIGSNPAAKLLSIRAWKMPTYTTDVMIEESASKYADQVLIECIEAMDE